MNRSAITNFKRPRKQLSDLLDRLSDLINTLRHGLNDHMDKAARRGARLAVEETVVARMSDPTLRVRLHSVTAPEPTVQPSGEPIVPQKNPCFWS